MITTAGMRDIVSKQGVFNNLKSCQMKVMIWSKLNNIKHGLVN
jgi:hypothetical protein